MRLFAVLLVAMWPASALAADKASIVETALSTDVLPGFEDLAARAADLETTAGQTCDPADPALRRAYAAAFDAWIRVSHLRFGPTETDSRAFALAFWPDTRGATPKSLTELLLDDDPAMTDPETFATVSVAARGFYALEFLLFDPGFAALGTDEARCTLMRAISSDIATTSRAVLDDWTSAHADAMRAPGADGSPYRDSDDAVRALYTALTTGLEMTSDMRLGRPLGTFERPRPKRAEARRSGRSLHHVVLSLESLRDLGVTLSALSPEAAETLDDAFAQALDQAERIDDPVFASVSDPQGRFRVEVLQQRIDEIGHVLGAQIGPELGIAAGFNALDGD